MNLVLAISKHHSVHASTRIQIYTLKHCDLDGQANGKFETKCKLEMIHDMDGKHESSISCMDWSKKLCGNGIDSTDKEEGVGAGIREGNIVSCGKDSQVYVWMYCSITSVWLPSLVVIGNMDNSNITTPIQCRWDPLLGCRLAIALGGNSKSSAVAICHWDEEFNWWTSSVHVGKKQIKSSVLCVAWHPYLQVVACGGTDYRCRIYSVADDKHKNEENLITDSSLSFLSNKK